MHGEQHWKEMKKPANLSYTAEANHEDKIQKSIEYI